MSTRPSQRTSVAFTLSIRSVMKVSSTAITKCSYDSLPLLSCTDLWTHLPHQLLYKIHWDLRSWQWHPQWCMSLLFCLWTSSLRSPVLSAEDAWTSTFQLYRRPPLRRQTLQWTVISRSMNTSSMYVFVGLFKCIESCETRLLNLVGCICSVVIVITLVTSSNLSYAPLHHSGLPAVLHQRQQLRYVYCIR